MNDDQADIAATERYGERHGDEYHGPRYVKGQRAHYRRVRVQYWVGGRGYKWRTEYNVWNPADCGALHAGDEMPENPDNIFHFHSREDFERFTDDEAPMYPKATRSRRARHLIKEAGEAVVCFRKRTGDGELRTMRCRPAPGIDYRFDPAEKDLLPVHDLDKDGRRFVTLDGVRWIMDADGERHELTPVAV